MLRKYKASLEDIVQGNGFVDCIMYARQLLLKYNMLGENTIKMLHIQEYVWKDKGQTLGLSKNHSGDILLEERLAPIEQLRR